MRTSHKPIDGCSIRARPIQAHLSRKADIISSKLKGDALPVPQKHPITTWKAGDGVVLSLSESGGWNLVPLLLPTDFVTLLNSPTFFQLHPSHAQNKENGLNALQGSFQL